MVKRYPSFTPVLESIGLTQDDLQNPSFVASGIEFILEGLHLSKLLNKEAMGDSGVYRARPETNGVSTRHRYRRYES